MGEFSVMRALVVHQPGGPEAMCLEQLPAPQSPRLGGNNFWGVEVWTHPATGEEYILASDRDSGLWIFQDP